MKQTINKNYWEEILRHPDWYIRLEKELKDVFSSNAKKRTYRHEIYEFIGNMLQEDKISLANDGPNLDKERQAIDTAIIHHTKGDSDILLDTLSAIGLLRQYAMDYLKKDVLDYDVYGKPIWSGHFRNNKQVFFAYHWLIRPDGTSEKLLDDSYIGWHAGNWDINTRSVGIALAGNYEQTVPTNEQINAIAIIISAYYPTIKKERILGHREVNKKTKCPGNKFLSEWKNNLYELIN